MFFSCGDDSDGNTGGDNNGGSLELSSYIVVDDVKYPLDEGTYVLFSSVYAMNEELQLICNHAIVLRKSAITTGDSAQFMFTIHPQDSVSIQGTFSLDGAYDGDDTDFTGGNVKVYPSGVEKSRKLKPNATVGITGDRFYFYHNC